MAKLEEFLNRILAFLTAVYVTIVVVLLPYYFNPQTLYRTIGTDKATLYQSCGVILGAVFGAVWIVHLIVAIACKKYPKKPTTVDIFLGIYLLATIIGFCLIPTKDTRDLLWVGQKSWFMGLKMQLLLVGSYFAVSRYFDRKWIKPVLMIMLGVNLPVWGMAICDRFGLHIFDLFPYFAYMDKSFVGTFGNINWLCGHWVLVYPFALGFWLFDEQKKVRVFAVVCGLIGFVCAAVQGSDSGVVSLLVLIFMVAFPAVRDREIFRRMLLAGHSAMAALLIIGVLRNEDILISNYPTELYKVLTGLPFLCIAEAVLLVVTVVWIWKFDLLKRLWVIAGVAGGAVLAVYIVLLIRNTLEPGSIGALSDYGAFRFDYEWGNMRGANWRAGLWVFAAANPLQRLFGVGPDGMAPFIYGGDVPALREMVLDVYPEKILTNAHNEWITVLADKGMIGLIGFIGAEIAFVYRSFAACRQQKQTTFDRICLYFLGVAVICYIVNDVFSFQTVMNGSLLYILMGFGVCMTGRDNNDETAGPERPEAGKEDTYDE